MIEMPILQGRPHNKDWFLIFLVITQRLYKTKGNAIVNKDWQIPYKSMPKHVSRSFC